MTHAPVTDKSRRRDLAPSRSRRDSICMLHNVGPEWMRHRGESDQVSAVWRSSFYQAAGRGLCCGDHQIPILPGAWFASGTDSTSSLSIALDVVGSPAWSASRGRAMCRSRRSRYSVLGLPSSSWHLRLHGVRVTAFQSRSFRSRSSSASAARCDARCPSGILKVGRWRRGRAEQGMRCLGPVQLLNTGEYSYMTEQHQQQGLIVR